MVDASRLLDAEVAMMGLMQSYAVHQSDSHFNI